MAWNEDRQLEKAREELVVKDNRLLQTVTQRKNELKAQEQKAVGYLLSMIKPEDKYRKPPYRYTFDIATFCDICGIDRNSGSNLQSIKNTLESLAVNGFWIKGKKGDFKTHLYFQWIAAPEILEGTGKVEIDIPDKIFPYLVGLTEKFTQYELWQILPMKSTYSIAIFELCKSYAYKHEFSVPLEDLRAYLGIKEEKYKDFRRFQQKILNVAKKEINELTDLTISWVGIRKGRSYHWIKFTVDNKENWDALEAYRKSTAILNGIEHAEGQINIFE